MNVRAALAGSLAAALLTVAPSCLLGPELLLALSTVEIVVTGVETGDHIALTVGNERSELEVPPSVSGEVRLYEQVAPGAHRASLAISRGGEMRCEDLVIEVQPDRRSVVSVDVNRMAACSLPTSTDAGPEPDVLAPDAGLPDAGRPDAGLPDAGRPDAGAPVDGGAAIDGGEGDAGGDDAGMVADGGAPPDAGVLPDGGMALDGGAFDGGDPDPDGGSPFGGGDIERFKEIVELVFPPGCTGGGCRQETKIDDKLHIHFKPVDQSSDKINIAESDVAFVAAPSVSPEADDLFDFGCGAPTDAGITGTRVELVRRTYETEGEAQSVVDVTDCDEGAAQAIRSRINAVRNVYFPGQ